MVYQNHRLETIDSMKEVDGKRYPLGSFLPPREAMVPIVSSSLKI
jgi:hypothetical protein